MLRLLLVGEQLAQGATQYAKASRVVALPLLGGMGKYRGFHRELNDLHFVRGIPLSTSVRALAPAVGGVAHSMCGGGLIGRARILPSFHRNPSSGGNIGRGSGQVRTFIQMMTQVSVMDNSGARVVRAIKPLGGPKKRQGLLGDTVVVSVRKPNPKSSFRLYKGDLALGLITQTKRKTRRPDGSYIRFDRNAVCILDKKSKDHMGNRVLGTVPLEVRKRTKDGGKIIDLASMTL